MKISINFYTDELKPQKEYLTLTNIVGLAFIISVSMLVWFASLTIEIKQTQQKAKLLDQEMGYAQQELTTLQQALIKHNDGSSFVKQKQQLQHRINAKQALLDTLTLRQDAINFYRVMRELTEHHDHNIWLTDFSFNQNDVIFNGYATESNAVTRWLSYLQNTHSFKGREFSHLNIQAVDDKVLEFQAATSINSVDAGVTR